MAQPDAPFLAEFAHSYGYISAAVCESKLSEVRTGLQQHHQQQLNDELALASLQHQHQLAAAQQQHQQQMTAAQQQHQQQLAAVHEQLEAKIQELAVSNQALTAVRAALGQVAPMPAAVQHSACGVRLEPAADVTVDEDLAANEPDAGAAEDADDADNDALVAHVAPAAVQPLAKRARLSAAERDLELRDAHKAYTVDDHDGWGVISRRYPPAQAAAFWRMYQLMMKYSDDDGACDIFNALSEADKAAVAVMRTTEKNCLLMHACPFGCVQVIILLVSKGATKDLTKDVANPDVKCYDRVIKHFASERPTDLNSKEIEGLAMLILLNIHLACAWKGVNSTKTRPKWERATSISNVLQRLLIPLKLDSTATAALIEHLIDVLDTTSNQGKKQVIDVSVCQFDSVKPLMPTNTPDWLVALVATIFSMQYEQGGAAIAQEMRQTINNHFNFDIPA
eukprot:13558-Heterococcus_DN1.PRE.1